MSPAGRLIAIARAAPSSERSTSGWRGSTVSSLMFQASMGSDPTHFLEPIRSRAMRIEGSGAIVVGGASGLGEATARALASRGAQVLIADVNEEKGNNLADELGIDFAKADVTKPDEVEAAVAQAAQADGGLRISMHYAGVGWAELVASSRGPHQLQPFGIVIGINLIGTFNALRFGSRAMLDNAPDDGGERG